MAAYKTRFWGTNGMKIIIDGRMLNWTGVGRYSTHLLEQLERLDQKNEYLVLVLAKDFDAWKPSNANFQRVVANFQPYSLGEQFGLALLLYRQRADLVHFPSFNQPILYRGKKITTINDLTLVEYKNIRGGGIKRLLYTIKYRVMKLVLAKAISSSNLLITYTEHVKQQLVREYLVPQNKITAIPLAADTIKKHAESIVRLRIKEPFLLYVGNSYPHKNLERLLAAFVQISAKHPDLSLVLAGAEDYFYEQLKQVSIAKGLSDKVIFTGFVHDGELLTLYKKAKLLVFPSLSEGFGLPPLEAMAHGTPVAASRVSCLPEVLGDAVAYFDPMSAHDIAQKVIRLLDNPAELDELNQRAESQLKKFDWEKTGEQTIALYRRIGGTNKR